MEIEVANKTLSHLVFVELTTVLICFNSKELDLLALKVEVSSKYLAKISFKVSDELTAFDLGDFCAFEIGVKRKNEIGI